jgi:AcrR family transcriptional regulator
MPKLVDHEERRRHVVDALLRVVARDGLEAVSLRHVAAEAGVTAGMVQHYFPSKDAMMEFAMHVASARYEQAITRRLERLGGNADPGRILSAILGGLLPTDAGADDARVALAFQTYAAGRAAAAEHLEEANARLRGHLAELIGAAGADIDPQIAATALAATAEGLGVQMLSARLPEESARKALAQHINLILGATVLDE